MMTLKLQKTINYLSFLADKIYVSYTEKEYNNLVNLLDQLIDEVGENEHDPLASLMEIIGILIENYEDTYVPELD